MSSNGGSSSKGSTNSMVWWDMQTVPPPANYHFMDHLLASHRAMGTGLFSLCPPVKLRAHGTEPLADAAYDYIVKSKLLLQQSISCGSEKGSCWKAMMVDMLLWATEHASGIADMVIISRVLDPSLADVIHQLHARNYNIIVTSSFPPKIMTLLRQCVPPIKTLHQMFPHCDFLANTMEVKIGEASIAAKYEEASIRAINSQPQESLSHVTTFCSQMMGNCKILIEEFLRKGITEFLECDLYAFFRMRFGERLNHNQAGFVKLDAFLQAAVPGVSFTIILVGTKPWILCSSPGHALRSNLPQQIDASAPTPNSVHVSPPPSCRNMIEDMRVRQSMPISEPRPTTSTQVLYYDPLTVEEVRNWLDEMIASGRADTGINLSLLGKDFEEHKGKKLNYKSLHCPTLTVLLSKFENLVRLERSESMVHLYPRDMQSRKRGRPTVPENVPVNHQFIRPQRLFCPPMNCATGVSVWPPCTFLPKIVQVPGQISIRKNIPTAVPVPKFSMASNTTVRTPTANTVTVPRTAPSTSEVKIEPAGEQASEEKHPLIANHLSEADIAENYYECQVSLLPNVEQNPAPSNIVAACKPESPQISMASKVATTPPADSVKVACTAPTPSETEIELAGGKHHLPNGDTAAATCGNGKVNQAPDGEDAKQGTCGDAGSGKKFDFYSLKVVQEREAIKRTFQSVNKRLQEEFKKRRLAQQQVAEASDQANNA